MLTQVQADVFITGDFLQCLPEPFLGIVGRTQVRNLKNGFVETDFCQHGIGINTGVNHGLVGHS